MKGSNQNMNKPINQLDDLLLPRKITNTGKNTITIHVDQNYRQYLIGHGKQCEGSNTLKPNQHLFVEHMYIGIFTDDGKPASLLQEFV